MKKPQNFTLSKVKLVNGGGIHISYQEKNEVKGITNTVDWDTKNSDNPHHDLVNKIEELKEYLAKCYKMDSLLVLSKSKGLPKADKDAFKIVAKVVENVYQKMIENIAITGVSITGEMDGDKDKRSVVITGTMLQDNKSKTALNSPRIKLANDQFKFEAEIQEIINDLDEEVIAYLFEGKRGQLDMFNPPKEEKLSQDFIEGNMKKVEDEVAA